MKSLRSVQSGFSHSTMNTIASKRDTEKTIFCFINREAVVARQIEVPVYFNKEHEAEFRYVRMASCMCDVITSPLDAKARSRESNQVHGVVLGRAALVCCLALL